MAAEGATGGKGPPEGIDAILAENAYIIERLNALRLAKDNGERPSLKLNIRVELEKRLLSNLEQVKQSTPGLEGLDLKLPVAAKPAAAVASVGDGQTPAQAQPPPGQILAVASAGPAAVIQATAGLAQTPSATAEKKKPTSAPKAKKPAPAASRKTSQPKVLTGKASQPSKVSSVPVLAPAPAPSLPAGVLGPAAAPPAPAPVTNATAPAPMLDSSGHRMEVLEELSASIMQMHRAPPLARPGTGVGEGSLPGSMQSMGMGAGGPGASQPGLAGPDPYQGVDGTAKGAKPKKKKGRPPTAQTAVRINAGSGVPGSDSSDVFGQSMPQPGNAPLAATASQGSMGGGGSGGGGGGIVQALMAGLGGDERGRALLQALQTQSGGQGVGDEINYLLQVLRQKLGLSPETDIHTVMQRLRQVQQQRRSLQTTSNDQLDPNEANAFYEERNMSAQQGPPVGGMQQMQAMSGGMNMQPGMGMRQLQPQGMSTPFQDQRHFQGRQQGPLAPAPFPGQGQGPAQAQHMQAGGFTQGPAPGYATSPPFSARGPGPQQWSPPGGMAMGGMPIRPAGMGGPLPGPGQAFGGSPVRQQPPPQQQLARRPMPIQQMPGQPGLPLPRAMDQQGMGMGMGMPGSAPGNMAGNWQRSGTFPGLTPKPKRGKRKNHGTPDREQTPYQGQFGGGPFVPNGAAMGGALLPDNAHRQLSTLLPRRSLPDDGGGGGGGRPGIGSAGLNTPEQRPQGGFSMSSAQQQQLLEQAMLIARQPDMSTPHQQRSMSMGYQQGSGGSSGGGDYMGRPSEGLTMQEMQQQRALAFARSSSTPSAGGISSHAVMGVPDMQSTPGSGAGNNDGYAEPMSQQSLKRQRSSASHGHSSHGMLGSPRQSQGTPASASLADMATLSRLVRANPGSAPPPSHFTPPMQGPYGAGPARDMISSVDREPPSQQQRHRFSSSSPQRTGAPMTDGAAAQIMAALQSQRQQQQQQDLQRQSSPAFAPLPPNAPPTQSGSATGTGGGSSAGYGSASASTANEMMEIYQSIMQSGDHGQSQSQPQMPAPQQTSSGWGWSSSS